MFQWEGTQVNLWLIHVDVWQKAMQYCKIITVKLQLKTSKFRNNKKSATKDTVSKVTVAQSGPTLCDPLNCSPPGSFTHGISQTRILEWVAIPFSRGFPQPRDQPRSRASQADSLPSEPPGKPQTKILCFSLKMGFIYLFLFPALLSYN